jgi:hypothetical protein
MNLSPIFWTWFSRVAVVFLLLSMASTHAFAANMKLEAQLVWGTNDDSSPDPGHKPVKGKVLEKLKKLPLKWKNYFEVTRKELSVQKGESTRTPMSKDCEIQVRNLGADSIEVTLFGKGKEVNKTTQSLPEDRMLVIGGNAENFTSWFVVLRRID